MASDASPSGPMMGQGVEHPAKQRKHCVSRYHGDSQCSRSSARFEHPNLNAIGQSNHWRNAGITQLGPESFKFCKEEDFPSILWAITEVNCFDGLWFLSNFRLICNERNLIIDKTGARLAW